MSKHSSTRREFPTGQPVTGRIGIFWWHEGKLLALVCRVDEGECAAGTVDSRFAHIESWPLLQKQHPRLRGLEYEDVPRGRVIFLSATRRFRVLMDKTLFQPDIKAAILDRFSLPKGRTRFVRDHHYTTDPKDLDRLFDDWQGHP